MRAPRRRRRMQRGRARAERGEIARNHGRRRRWHAESIGRAVAVRELGHPASGNSLCDRRGLNHDLSFGGYYSWNGTSGPRVTRDTRSSSRPRSSSGRLYRFSLTTSNVSEMVPVVLKATLSGGGPEQSQMIFGDGTLQMTFTITSPGDAPPGRVDGPPSPGTDRGRCRTSAFCTRAMTWPRRWSVSNSAHASVSVGGGVRVVGSSDPDHVAAPLREDRWWRLRYERCERLT